MISCVAQTLDAFQVAGATVRQIEKDTGCSVVVNNGANLDLASYSIVTNMLCSTMFGAVAYHSL